MGHHHSAQGDSPSRPASRGRWQDTRRDMGRRGRLGAACGIYSEHGTEWDPVPCSEYGNDEPDPEERNIFVEERVECIARDWMRHVLPDPRVLREQAERIATQVTGIAPSQKGLGLTS